MARSKSSKRWLERHEQDEYVQMAREQGYRSRAVFKLRQLHEKDRIFEPGQRVLDLGAAPGGWSEYAIQAVGEQGKVFALDIL
ncbi:MAG: RlmE family RNA methyltransferase, partial [Gammaproteobacteria bacterium]